MKEVLSGPGSRNNVEFCDDSFEKVVCYSWKCVESGGNDVER
jgi:hypothetical protein